MLHWAEGDKKRNLVGFSNSDPEVMRFFVRFLRTCFAVNNEALRLRCFLYADHEERQREIEQYWLSLLGLQRSSLQRSTVNRYSRASKRKRIRLLPNGTARIVVHDTQVVQAIYGGIQELAAFDRPEWLDL